MFFKKERNIVSGDNRNINQKHIDSLWKLQKMPIIMCEIIKKQIMSMYLSSLSALIGFSKRSCKSVMANLSLAATSDLRQSLVAQYQILLLIDFQCIALHIYYIKIYQTVNFIYQNLSTGPQFN